MSLLLQIIYFLILLVIGYFWSAVLIDQWTSKFFHIQNSGVSNYFLLLVAVWTLCSFWIVKSYKASGYYEIRDSGNEIVFFGNKFVYRILLVCSLFAVLLFLPSALSNSISAILLSVSVTVLAISGYNIVNPPIQIVLDKNGIELRNRLFAAIWRRHGIASFKPYLHLNEHIRISRDEIGQFELFKIPPPWFYTNYILIGLNNGKTLHLQADFLGPVLVDILKSYIVSYEEAKRKTLALQNLKII